MDRSFDVKSEESSDNEESHKIKIPRTTIKTVDILSSLYKDRFRDPYEIYVRNHNAPSTSKTLFFESRRDNETSELRSLKLKPRSTKESENEPQSTDLNVTTSELNVDIYDLDSCSKNLMIIFNHESFLNDNSRGGTRHDVKALKRTFQEFRFLVTTHNDLEKNELFAELDKFSEQNFGDCGCICVAILTHGSDHGYLEAYDQWYSEREVYACFETRNKPSLVGKPIIFLIQACRGVNLAPSVSAQEYRERSNIELDSGSRQEGDLSYPAESNMIIFHSCFFGRASVRDTNYGTWFIQTVCEQINKHASGEHLEDIFRRVRNIVATEFEEKGAKQMPVSTSALVKKLFLKK